MIKFLARKTGMLILIFIGITFLSFCLTYLSPSDPAEIKLNKTGVPPTEELLEQTRKEMGLDRPLLIRYGDWLLDMMKGDMGTSIRNGKPVVSELKKALPQTAALTFVSMAAVLLISIPFGVLCARFKDGPFDIAVRFVTYLFASLPSFFLALVFLYLFSVKLGWFPVIAPKGIRGIIMPALVLALTLSAWYIRQVRTIVLDELSKEYIAGSRARGVPERQILFSHVLRNAMLPITTLVGVSLAGMLGGTTIVENVFSWPGLGQLAMEAITARDYPVIQGYVVWMALIFLLVNFLVDLSYGWIDPKVRR
ncbi:nickel ABC transporter permease [Qiania dongpingensis]|uniref:Nickel import system permease protein NikB n=1 Tax=Qiania dongpingensis TaxID=2763669 RepID=A0A7G9G2L2_9FIRM|nr:nickel ABC transporter permease [Qiania dongpingensis]QNM05044.1 ABC transporter permease [Qiania dongpingensis]